MTNVAKWSKFAGCASALLVFYAYSNIMLLDHFYRSPFLFIESSILDLHAFFFSFLSFSPSLSPQLCLDCTNSIFRLTLYTHRLKTERFQTHFSCLPILAQIAQWPFLSRVFSGCPNLKWRTMPKPTSIQVHISAGHLWCPWNHSFLFFFGWFSRTTTRVGHHQQLIFVLHEC